MVCSKIQAITDFTSLNGTFPPGESGAIMIYTSEDDLMGKLAEFLSEEQSDLAMNQFTPILQELRASIRDLNEKYEETEKKYEETNDKLGKLDKKFEDFKDLLTAPMGLNISRQVCSWIHDSWGESLVGGESYIDFLQRATLSTEFLRRCLHPHATLLDDLESLRDARNTEIHGILPVCQQIISFQRSTDLMNTISVSQPFAAKIIEHARPMLFQIAATVTMQFCKDYLFHGTYYDSKKYFKRCTSILYESLQLSTGNATMRRLSKNDVRMMFKMFEKSTLIKNFRTNVTRQQIVSLLNMLVADETEILPPHALCPANPIADIICSVGVELMQSSQDLGKIAPSGTIELIQSRLTRKSASVDRKFTSLGR